MTRQAIIERTLKAISQLPEGKAEEISDFADFVIKRFEQTDKLFFRAITEASWVCGQVGADDGAPVADKGSSAAANVVIRGFHLAVDGAVTVEAACDLGEIFSIGDGVAWVYGGYWAIKGFGL